MFCIRNLDLAIFLFACSEDIKTMKCWKQHQDELKVFLKKCHNGEIDKNSQACENARSAANHNLNSIFPNYGEKK
ncbi:EexN family lipoprotein [Gilliamella mensalis]|uniref:EexN family lipoprotein n=1 Tax=Gilliamella mensalis TaxID=1908520 RepID=UPI0027B90113|nr:EexN family lipoprotein [Gilliamella mensalis]